jgi:hypothetical protein
MIKPEKLLLSRLSEGPALVVHGSDTVDCEGPLVFIDIDDRDKISGAVVPAETARHASP